MLAQDNYESVLSFVNRINEKYEADCKELKAFSDTIKKKWVKQGLRRDLWEYLRADIQNANDEHLTFDEVTEAAFDAEHLYNFKKPTMKPWVFDDNKGNFKVDSEGFAVVYTAGASVIREKFGVRAGIGVYFASDHKLNVSEAVSLSEPSTKNAAEICAVIKAFTIASQYGVYRLAVHIGFPDLYKSVTKKIFTWLRNGWTHPDGSPIEGKVHYKKLLSKIHFFDIKWIYVPAIRGVKRHVKAQEMAVEAARSCFG